MRATFRAPSLDRLDEGGGYAPAPTAFPHEEVLEEAGGTSLGRRDGELDRHHADEEPSFLRDEGRGVLASEDGEEASLLLDRVRGEIRLDAEELADHPGHLRDVGALCPSYFHERHIEGFSDE